MKKEMTDRAVELSINKLKELSKNEDIQKQIIEQSIMNNWQSFYPLKNKDGYSGSNKQKS
jgi:hypothetical protein